MVEDYSANNTWEWTAAPSEAGTHTVVCLCENAGSAAAVEASKYIGYSLVVDTR